MAIFILLLTGCAKESAPVTEKKGQTFAASGIRFDCPADWQISEPKQTLENEFWIACEKMGPTAAGLAIIKWTRENLAPNTLLNLLKESYQNDYRLLYEVDLQFSDEKEASTVFSFSAAGIEHRGRIETKKCPAVAAGLIFQTTADAFKADNESFEKISASFSCE